MIKGIFSDAGPVLCPSTPPPTPTPPNPPPPPFVTDFCTCILFSFSVQFSKQADFFLFFSCFFFFFLNCALCTNRGNKHKPQCQRSVVYFFPTVSLLALFRAAESVGRKTASQSGCGCAGGTGLGLASQSREGGGGGGGEGGRRKRGHPHTFSVGTPSASLMPGQ